MAQREPMLEAAGDGLTLQARFLWHQDRFAHTVTILKDDRAAPALASREGTGQQPWPPGPPLQTCSAEMIAGEPAMLLVGMAGDAHWSLAVTAEQGRGALVFDAACRLKSTPEVLGSEYRAMVAPQVAVGGQSATLGLDLATIRVELIVLDEESPARIVATASGLAVAVAPGPIGSAQTLRWKYRISAG